ncbi:MAG: carbon storage regulator [Pyrinomonadaceae bacterium]
MLVLSRRKGEKIVIGNEIVIEVISAGADGVRLGITAPRETSVHRFEVAEEIERANRAAEEVLRTIETNVLENLAAHLSKER